MASDGTQYDTFGSSVSISGDYAVVGSYHDDDSGIFNSGSAYIFKLQTNRWIEQLKLKASDEVQRGEFGYSISINSDYIIVGAIGADGNEPVSGSAYIFQP